LKPVEASTQIVQRDRYAEAILLLALIASSLEKIATELRELQRSEIGEVREAFGKSQVGSSTMPHKMNPMTSERICGLSKVIRGIVIPALENVTYWNERDLTQSSTERFIIPTAFIVVDYILHLTTRVLSTLSVNVSKMRDNMSLTGGAFMSESVMLALTRKGLARQEAHEVVRQIAVSSVSEEKKFGLALLEDKRIEKYMTKKEIEAALNPQNYLGTTEAQIAIALRTARKQLSLNSKRTRK
ncbi:MAG: lyase family protein, partial [Candidatus Bathyarchaeia archaeon]